MRDDLKDLSPEALKTVIWGRIIVSGLQMGLLAVIILSAAISGNLNFLWLLLIILLFN